MKTVLASVRTCDVGPVQCIALGDLRPSGASDGRWPEHRKPRAGVTRGFHWLLDLRLFRDRGSQVSGPRSADLTGHWKIVKQCHLPNGPPQAQVLLVENIATNQERDVWQIVVG